MQGAGEGGAAGQGEPLQARIAELQARHRELDEAIDQLVRAGPRDDLQLQRLKKRKLQLKDAIVRLQMSLVPDIPA